MLDFLGLRINTLRQVAAALCCVTVFFLGGMSELYGAKQAFSSAMSAVNANASELKLDANCCTKGFAPLQAIKKAKQLTSQPSNQATNQAAGQTAKQAAGRVLERCDFANTDVDAASVSKNTKIKTIAPVPVKTDPQMVKELLQRLDESRLALSKALEDSSASKSRLVHMERLLYQLQADKERLQQSNKALHDELNMNRSASFIQHN